MNAQVLDDCLQEIKDYVDCQIEFHNSIIERLKCHKDMLEEDVIDREWNAAIHGKNVLWGIKAQVDCFLEENKK